MDGRGKKILFYRGKRVHIFRRLIGCQNPLFMHLLLWPVEEKSTFMTRMDFFFFPSACSLFAFSVFRGWFFSFSSSSLLQLFKTYTHAFLLVLPVLLSVPFLLPLLTTHLKASGWKSRRICSVAWSVPICNMKA